MGIYEKKDGCNLLKQIALPCPTFTQYLDGKKGDKKRLLANCVNNYDESFLQDCIDQKDIVKLHRVEYLTLSKVEELFGYRKYNIQNWTSPSKLNLLRCLENTPICYVYHISAHLISLDSLYPLFGKSEQYNPVEEVCTKCAHFETCKGASIFRKTDH